MGRAKMGEAAIAIDETERFDAEFLFQAVFENSEIGVAVIDDRGRAVRSSATVRRILGGSFHRLGDLRAGADEISTEEAISRALGDRTVTFERVVARPVGRRIRVRVTLTAPRIEASRPRLLVALFREADDTDRREEEARTPLRDALTGIPNRALFFERLRRAIERPRDDGSTYAVLFIDIDRFKTINDSLGHLIGDELLIETTRRLRGVLRPSDTLARLGGDEFAVLADDLRRPQEAERIAERIRSVVEPPFRLAGGDRFLTVSVGVAWGDGGYSAPEELLRDADVAMYAAKDRGRDRHAMFEIGMRMRAVESLSLAEDLRRALDAGEVTAEFQPIVRLEDRRVVGFDARPRWRHPIRGRMTPEAITPVAERHGLTRALDEAVLRSAAGRLASWRETVADFPAGLFIGAAVSPSELARDDLAESLARVVREAGADPRDILLEFRPEGASADSRRDIARAAAGSRAAGFRAAAQNFGAGAISLADLTRARFDVLKLDSALTSAVTLGGGRLEIVRGVLSLAASLGMGVIAEGIETVERETVLMSLNTPAGQGGLYGAPLSGEAASALLSGGTRRDGTADLMAGI